MIAGCLGALCPVPPPRDASSHEHEHVPHDDTLDTRPVLSLSAFGSLSSSGDVLSWSGNSLDVAAGVATRRRRDSHAGLRGLHQFSTAAVILGAGGSTGVSREANASS